MKGAIKLSFERNDYYTGKLLSARDFIVEQKYFNDKRRQLNLFTEGHGVLYGLEVLKTGDNRQEESISIKPGIAIDPLGREVLIPQIDTRVLSELEGFPADEYIGALYLCLEYEESGKAEASLSEGSNDNEKRFNRIAEGYKLILKTQPPSTPLSCFARYRYNAQLLYADEKIIIWHKSPRFICANDSAEASFICVKLQKNLRVKVEYQADLQGLLIDGQPNDIQFESSDRSDITEFEYKYCLKGMGSNGSITFSNENLKIIIGDSLVNINAASVAVQSIETSIREQVIKDYYKENLRDFLDSKLKENLYLAKIFITQARSVLGIRYHINHVENSIFTDYIHPKQLTQSIYDCSPSHMSAVEPMPKPQYQPMPKPKNSVEVKTGVVEIYMDLPRNHCCYSSEIRHELGPGPVLIATGLEEAVPNPFAETETCEVIYSGDYGVFDKSEYSSTHAGLSIGVMTFPQKGSFIIGIRSNETKIGEKVKIRWWAYQEK